MMPVARYSAMNKTTGTGPSSMMAAIMVTAATCNQNEKIEKQTTTIYPSEDVNKLKVLSTGNSNANNSYIYLCIKREKKHTAFFHEGFLILFSVFYLVHIRLFALHLQMNGLASSCFYFLFSHCKYNVRARIRLLSLVGVSKLSSAFFPMISFHFFFLLNIL